MLTKDLCLTSPAPCMTKTLSLSFLPVILRDANTPAAATAAVPVEHNNKDFYYHMTLLLFSG